MVRNVNNLHYGVVLETERHILLFYLEVFCDVNVLNNEDTNTKLRVLHFLDLVQRVEQFSL